MARKNSKTAPIQFLAAAVTAVAQHKLANAWVPAVKYATTINNAVAGAAKAASGPVLVAVGVTTARAGTARAAALAALLANVGQPRNVVLGAVAEAEKEWHRSNGRTPGQVSPTGWLRTMGAAFSAEA